MNLCKKRFALKKCGENNVILIEDIIVSKNLNTHCPI